MQPLTTVFYERDDVVEIAHELIGCILVVESEPKCYLYGRIVETEAYRHCNDLACHANNFRRTRTNASMFGPGGTCYVYRCYGIHNLFNIVCNHKGIPDAVLIRALEPLVGIPTMCKRRNRSPADLIDLTSGPGKLTQAFGIDMSFDGESLIEGRIKVFRDKDEFQPVEICTSARIGVSYAGEDAKLPWRFFIAGNQFVSRTVKSQVVVG